MKQIYINNTLQWFSQLLTKESFQQLFLLGVIVENEKTQPYLLIEEQTNGTNQRTESEN